MGQPEVLDMRSFSHRSPEKQLAPATLCGASGALQTFDGEGSLCRYYGANAPVYQVDILDTNTVTFHGGERSYHWYLLPLLTVCFSLSRHTGATAVDAFLQGSIHCRIK